MRLWLFLLAVLTVLIFMIIDPVALVRLGAICATGGCGVRPRWIWGTVAALVLIWLITRIIAGIVARFRRPPPPPPPPKPARRRPSTPRPKRDKT